MASTTLWRKPDSAARFSCDAGLQPAIRAGLLFVGSRVGTCCCAATLGVSDQAWQMEKPRFTRAGKIGIGIAVMGTMAIVWLWQFLTDFPMARVPDPQKAAGVLIDNVRLISMVPGAPDAEAARCLASTADEALWSCVSMRRAVRCAAAVPGFARGGTLPRSPSSPVCLPPRRAPANRCCSRPLTSIRSSGRRRRSSLQGEQHLAPAGSGTVARARSRGNP